MGLISVVISTVVVNELFAGYQAYRLVSRRVKLLKQDLQYLESDPRPDVDLGDFLAHMERQEKEYPHLFKISYVPPTFFFSDEREKYLESRKWIKDGRPKHLVIKEMIQNKRRN
jgi:hypothetical protein